VPFYVIDGKYGISGGQRPQVFTTALEQAWADTHPLGSIAEDADSCADGAWSVQP
jgi:predicted DsbA family dithiol-disulfide isomerase